MDQQPQTPSPQAQPHPDSQGLPDLPKTAEVNAKNDAAVRDRFSPEAMRQKRDKAIAALRAERGIADPKAEGTDTPSPSPATDEQTKAQAPAAKPETKADMSKPQPAVEDDALAKRLADFDKKQQGLAAQEQKLVQLKQEAEHRQQDADKRIKDLELALADPLDFMSKVGMTEAEFKAFLGQGGTLTAEQRRLRESEKANQALQARLEELERKQQQGQAQIAEQMEVAEFKGQMDEYKLLKRMGGMQAVLQKRAQLQTQLGQPVSLKQTAEGLEKQYHASLSGLLQEEEIRTTFNLSTGQQPNGSQAATPKTLNGNFASATQPASAQKPAWNDWAAKRALAIKAMQADRQ
jgi:hypothetical protein